MEDLLGSELFIVIFQDWRNDMYDESKTRINLHAVLLKTSQLDFDLSERDIEKLTDCIIEDIKANDQRSVTALSLLSDIAEEQYKILDQLNKTDETFIDKYLELKEDNITDWTCIVKGASHE